MNTHFWVTILMSQGSSVNTVTTLRAGDQGAVLSRGRDFFLLTASRPALGPTQTPIIGVVGALSPRVKQPGREANHSSPSSAENSNAWSYASTPPYVFVAWCLNVILKSTCRSP